MSEVIKLIFFSTTVAYTSKIVKMILVILRLVLSGLGLHEHKHTMLMS